VTDKKKKYRSLVGVPIKVEVQPVQHQCDHVLSPEELAAQIDEARKGRAKVDSKYVNYADGRGHLFEYQLNYARFLDNMRHIITEAKARKKEDRYRSSHEIIIQ